MSGKEQPPIMDQKLCVAGCGFFGSSQTSNLCSKCWASKSLLAGDSQGKKEGSNVGASSLPPPLTLSKPSATPSPTAMDESDDTAPPAPVAQAHAQAEGAGVKSPSDAAAGSGAGAAAPAAPLTPPAIATTPAEAPARPVQKNRKRCFTCHKKVGYTGIACRCDYVFCSLHRYPEQHDCTFDFKTSDRNDLKRTVVGGGQFSKVDRL